MKQESLDEIRNKANHWYETQVVPCRHNMMQDIEAWYEEKDVRLREVMTLAYFYGYMEAMETEGKSLEIGKDAGWGE